MAVLLAPFALRGLIQRSVPAAPTRLDSGRGSALELRIITPHNQDIRHVFEAAFSDWHTEHYGAPVNITYLSPGGTNAIVRYLKDLYGSYRDAAGKLRPEAAVDSGIDLVWGGGDYTFEHDFKPFLKPLTLSSQTLREAFPSPDLAGVALFDPDALTGDRAPRWVGVVLSSFGVIYAPDFYAALGLPAPDTWADLARPELAGLLALADPTRSGTAGVTYMMVIERAMADAERAWLAEHPEQGTSYRPELERDASYRAALSRGWKAGIRILELMAANARYFTDNAGRPCLDVGDSEAAAGVAIDFYARVFQDDVGRQRIRYHAPVGATAITPDPIGVLYGTVSERERVANHFVEFLLSREGQRLWDLDAGQSPYVQRSLRRLPVRHDVYSDRKGWADDDDPFESAHGFNLRQRWMRPLGRLIPIWAAAWIDGKPDLDRAYRAVLAVQDPGRRGSLLGRLADIPVELADVSEAPPAPRSGEDAALRAARDRANWSERFRNHYLAVLRAAESEL